MPPARPKPNATRVSPPKPEKPNRDPNNLNIHLQTDYYSVLAEPQRLQSFDCVWEFSEVAYDCFKSCCYGLLSFFCGCWIAIFWGIAFVPSLFTTIWICTPFNSCLKIVLGFWCRSLWTLTARLCISPYTKACGSIFHHLGNGQPDRSETPSIFPKSKPRPKKKKEEPPPPPKPVVEKEEPEKDIVVVVPVNNEFTGFDKEKITRSVRRQMML